MRRAALCAVGVMAFGGCVIEPAHDNIAEVSVIAWGNSGSIFGANSVTILPDDRFEIRSRSSSATVNTNIRQAPSGTFETIARDATRDLDRLPAITDIAPCPDYGTDFLETRDASGAIIDRAEASCGGSGLEAVLQSLNAQLTRLSKADET